MLLTRSKGRRIAANSAKLPGLVRKAREHVPRCHVEAPCGPRNVIVRSAFAEAKS
jgi:hypothetical protein